MGVEQRASDADPVFDAAWAGARVPRPAEFSGAGLNDRSHAEEAKLDVPVEPLVLTGTPAGIGFLENRCVVGA